MSVEGAVRALWARAVGATLPRPAPDALERVHRVLFLRHDAIGDMLSSLGVIRALARHGLEVTVLASPANAPVLASRPWGVGVLTTTPRGTLHRGLHRALQAEDFDAVIDGLVLKPSVNTRTIALLRASQAPVRIGTAGRAHDFLYTHPVAADLTANHVEVLAALLRPFGIPMEEALEPVAMPLTDAERAEAETWWAATGAGTRLFVNLSASSAERRWPDGRFVKALREVLARHPGLRVAISGSPDDWPAARAIAEAIGGGSYGGSLRGAFALLSASDAALTPDTSVAHAAAGFRVPSVVLTPRGNLRFAPWRSRARLVVSTGRGVDDIGVPEVAEALAATIAELPPR